MNTNKIKKFQEHPFQVELEKLQKTYAPLIMEQRDLLKQVEATSLLDFETILNSHTSFVKASLSAEAMGLEKEHFRLVELERILDGKLTDDDVANDGKIKLKKKNEIREKYTVYFTKDELELNKQLQKVIDLYNEIKLQDRHKIVINNRKEMQFNPMVNRF